MTDQTATAITRAVPRPAARLEPDAIGWTQNTVIGMSYAAPAASLAVTLPLLVSSTSYGSGPILLLVAVPMLIIANAYRRLNMWQANCGASFEWVGRAINPYLGFMTGWLMIAALIVGTLANVFTLGPSVLAIAGTSSTNALLNLAIAAGVCAIMLVIAVVGIRFTARSQIAIAVVEYTILIGIAVAGLIAVIGHYHGSIPITRGWFSLTGIGGRGSLSGGLLVAVFLFSGWEGTVYVNEEVKHRRKNPGRAAITAVALLAVLYSLTAVGLQGLVPAAKLQANSNTALIYLAQALGGGTLAKLMALSLALSVIATTGIGIVLGARILYGMAGRRVLPEFLGRVSPRYSTPVGASVVIGVILIGLTAAYLLATSLSNAFTATVAISGLLFASYYILTALAAMVYYRRRIFTGVIDSVALGLLPLASAIFLGWIVVRSVQVASVSNQKALIAIVGTGISVMLLVRLTMKSPWFGIRRESYSRQH